MIISLVSAVIYGLGCWLFGENFPFSKYNLYSDTAFRDSSAVAVFMADGEAVNVWDYHRFSGLEPKDFLPERMPTGLTWISHELARWVSEHIDQEGDGPISVEFGYRMFSIDESGALQEKIEILQRGRAWPI